ncbi:MAG: alpha/beta fold hydrolase [Streptosporangiales bacterium]|nr:alpha/beta fold hydrolase [Streptosporangiales bacterium]
MGAVSAALVAGLAILVPAGAAAPRPEAAAPQGKGLDFRSCNDPTYKALECAKLRVPLDYRRPAGKKITLAVSRVKASGTPAQRQGALLVNPGGPGGSGLTFAGFIADNLPPEIAASYDVIGFDPRGVGRSTPALSCLGPNYFKPPRADYVPADADEERAWIERASSYAKACAENHSAMLPHMTTVNAARDMDRIRAALGERKTNYFGYSYGTYLGAVYGELFPKRVRRLVLDSIVDPNDVWYQANINQNYAFEARIKDFFGWVAQHDDAYHLGTSAAQVEDTYYSMRDKLEAQPAGDKVGPSELDDTFLIGGYTDAAWPILADAFSAYQGSGQTNGLVEAYDSFGAIDEAGENGYANYVAVECRDAPWPRNWVRWHLDATRGHLQAPFLTWNNTWYNAPCAFWPVPGGKPTEITGSGLPPVLLLQATKDAATPYGGAQTMHRLLDSSRLVVEDGGGNHGISLAGNECVDGHLARYLRDGTLPADRLGPDATCEPLPAPTPQGAQRTAASLGSQQHLDLVKFLRRP